jgi:replicative DNA helicase
MTGIFPSELTVIGGESGTGKTTFATQIILKASKEHKCAIYALEDRLEDYGLRALYFEIGKLRKKDELKNYPWNEFRKNNIKDILFNSYKNKAKQNLKNENIQFAKIEQLMNIDLLEHLIEEQVKNGVKLFLIDHLHYFDLLKEDMTKADYIEKTMIRLKTLLNKTKASMLLVVHYKKLNGQKPTLDSFKDSISIVQNANYVINLWRDRALKKNNEIPEKLISIFGGTEQVETVFYIPKSRNPNGEATITVLFDKSTGDYPIKIKKEQGTIYKEEESNQLQEIIF